MKQTRIIRILFVTSAMLIVGAFWGGFYFGENNTEPEHILIASDETSDTDSSGKVTDSSSDIKNAAAAEQQEEETEESMKNVEQERYYLKMSEEYLTVYYTETDLVYFETGLKLSDLPSDLQEEAKTGISFSNLEELYSFLENYSS